MSEMSESLRACVVICAYPRHGECGLDWERPVGGGWVCGVCHPCPFVSGVRHVIWCRHDDGAALSAETMAALRAVLEQVHASVPAQRCF